MYRPTLSDAKATSSGIERVVGLCAADARFTDYVNMAQRTLLNRGRWWGTYERRVLCTSKGCLTWPRDVADFEMVTLCKEPIPIHNQWYEFLGLSSGIQPNCGDCGSLGMSDRGMSSTFDDITGSDKTLRFYYTEASDIGKTILVKGYDENNIEIRTVIDGVMTDGFQMTLASPFVDSPFTVKRITGIQKPKTDGLIRLFEVSTAGTQRALGIYQATETKPWYRRSYINGVGSCSTSTCSSKQVNALVKLEFIPAEMDSDWLIIPNLDAIRYQIQSIKFREENRPGESIESEKAAIRELNHDLFTHTGGRVEVNVSLFARGRYPNRNFARIR